MSQRTSFQAPFPFWVWWGERFYPDFLAKTTSGIALILEYKGAHLVSATDAKHKEELGKMWEDVSNGTGRFWMVTATDIGMAIGAVKGL